MGGDRFTSVVTGLIFEFPGPSFLRFLLPDE
jgi:hypothetical protein